MKKILFIFFLPLPLLLNAQTVWLRARADMNSSGPVMLSPFDSGELPAGSTWVGEFTLLCRVWGKRFVIITNPANPCQADDRGFYFCYSGIRTLISTPSGSTLSTTYDYTYHCSQLDTNIAIFYDLGGGDCLPYTDDHHYPSSAPNEILYNPDGGAYNLGSWGPPAQNLDLPEHMAFMYGDFSNQLDTLPAKLRIRFIVTLGAAGHVQLKWGPAYCSASYDWPSYRKGLPLLGWKYGPISEVPTFWTQVRRGSTLWMKRIG
jgi:hypothetical protein